MAEGITGQSLAGLFDLDLESIRKLKHSGIVVGSAVRGRYLLAPSVRNYIRHLREVAAGRQGNELNAVDENARLKIVQRKNYELKNAALEGALTLRACSPTFLRWLGVLPLRKLIFWRRWPPFHFCLARVCADRAGN
jgi:phage terminase Nu1 subunit (DNA packaging protein)